jgi:curved DNA-binding protein CbpA
MAHLYEVLGIDSNAGAAEIKVAFHRLAKTHHPDLHAGDVVAEERFKEINHAYAY